MDENTNNNNTGLQSSTPPPVASSNQTNADFAPPPMGIDPNPDTATQSSSEPSNAEYTSPSSQLPDYMKVQDQTNSSENEWMENTKEALNQQMAEPPLPKQTNHKLIYAILGTIILVLLGVIGIMAMQSGSTKEPAPTQMPQQTLQPLPTMQPSPSPTADPTAEWELYTDELVYQFKYPKEATVEKQGTVLRAYYWGPTQTGGTEMFDGYNVNFEVKEISLDLEGLTDYAQTKLDESLDAGLGEMISPVERTTFNGYDAITYSFSGLGNFTYYYVLNSDSSTHVEISVINADPGNLGFKETTDQILSTFEFNDSDDAMMKEN